ncbi:MAG: ribosomal protein L13e [Candidatus Bathyarchaeia archaeon]|nr:ribosomal protein L13e [Candidatus Bathyarchaeota archaeon]
MKRPIVKSPGRKTFRIGRGFSLGELAEVGLSIDKARRLGIAVDRRRKTVRRENIEALRTYIESMDRLPVEDSKKA